MYGKLQKSTITKWWHALLSPLSVNVYPISISQCFLRAYPLPCSYVDYLLEAVAKRELFGLLRLEPEKWWHALLFRDRYNMLGISASIPQPLQDSLSQHPGRLTKVTRLGIQAGLHAS